MDSDSTVGGGGIIKERELLVSGGQERHGIWGNILADVIVTTPHRLLEHLSTSNDDGFTLKHLEYLVLDECDQLLHSDISEHWLSQVLDAIEQSKRPTEEFVSTGDLSLDAELYMRPELRGGGEQVRKLAFSATLSTHLGDLAALRLCKPKFYVSKHVLKQVDDSMTEVLDEAPDVTEQGQFILPDTLSQLYVVSPHPSNLSKPCTLTYLMIKNEIKSALCFVSSIDKAERLQKLCTYGPMQRYYQSYKESKTSPSGRIIVEFFSSALSVQQRNRTLEKF